MATSTRPGVDGRCDAADQRERRVEKLGRRLAIGLSQGIPLSFRVVSRGGIGAWAWESGKIEVSPRLADMLDDAELSAALAHEIGHLRKDGARDGQAAALTHAEQGESVERVADREGCALLRRTGLPVEAMPRMLAKVASALQEPHDFDERIQAALEACATAS